MNLLRLRIRFVLGRPNCCLFTESEVFEVTIAYLGGKSAGDGKSENH
jgi:hypothetical protein